MRDYFMPAMRYLTKVIPHPAVAKAFIMKRRAAVFTMIATILIVASSALLVIRQHSVAAENNRETPTMTNELPAIDPPKTAAGVQASQQITNTVSPSNTSTNVTVNNEQIQVPNNGSVHRTIHSDNGTTTVDVSVNGNSTNSNVSSSSLNVTSNSFSQKTESSSH
jgi:hypothetical protein